MKLVELLNSAREQLRASNIQSYKIDSLIIIGHELSLTKEQIFLNSNLVLTSDQIVKIRNSLQRRINKEPVSHIIGKRDFFEDQFLVNHNVLDPRPDSEVLIESVLKFFPESNSNLKILEMGVGSGCLILTILKKFPNSMALAVDVNEKSLEVAKINAKNLQLEKRVTFINSDWFKRVEEKDFDLIISNPPYIQTKEIDSLQEEVKFFEPRIALDGGEDGLDCYRIIAQDVAKFLKNRGYLFLEIGQNQEEDVRKIFSKNNLQFIDFKKDLSGIIRCLIFKKT